MNKLDKVISDERVSEEEYYNDIDTLVWEEIEYYWSKVKVEQVFKYVKYSHYYDWYTITDEQTDSFNKLGQEKAPWMKKLKYWEVNYPPMKAIYIVNFLDRKEWGPNKYMYTDTSALKHSEELRNN